MWREIVDMEYGDKIWREMGIRDQIQEDVIGGMEQPPRHRDMEEIDRDQDLEVSPT